MHNENNFHSVWVIFRKATVTHYFSHKFVTLKLTDKDKKSLKNELFQYNVSN